MNETTWVCVDGHGDERAFPCKPYKDFPNLNLEDLGGQRWAIDFHFTHFKGILLPKGTIQHLIGKELTYDDEPVQIISEKGGKE